jgi:hypothetical protein
MAERRRVMRKCVFGVGSSEVVVCEEEDEEVVSGGAEAGEDEEARRAATVREAAVPLWTEHLCIVRRELRNPLAVRVGRATLSMVVAECRVVCSGASRIRAISLVSPTQTDTDKKTCYCRHAHRLRS